MKKIFVVFLLFAILAMPKSVLAQQTGNTIQGGQLQSGGGGLQQAPAGLQGSTPQIFGGTGSGLLDQSNQKLLNGLGASGEFAPKQENKASIVQPPQGRSNTFLASLCLGLAALAGAGWLWLRRLEF